jgi:hypothetical protein
MLNKLPALDLASATVNLTPDQPLEPGDPWHVDLSKARGDQQLSLMRKEFERKGKPFIYAVFSSHRGIGKSTELIQFANDLKSKYATLRLVANNEFDSERIEIEDFLLVLCRAIEEYMRLVVKQPLPKETLDPVEKWFAELTKETTLGTDYVATLQTGIEAKAEIPFFGKLFGSFTALMKGRSEHKQSLKNAIRKYPGSLLNAVNNLLDAAGTILAPKNRQLLVIVDNMDRYNPKEIDSLLATEADKIKSIHCNLIVTPPVSLIYRPFSENINDIYNCFVLPNPKLRNRNGPYDTIGEPGRSALLDVLRRRLDIDRLIPDEKVRDRMILASGGSVRELIDIARRATLRSNATSIGMEDLEPVVVQRRSVLRDLCDTGGYWEALGKLADTKRLTDDPKCLDLLYHRLAFHFNGENWYDVHPLLTEIPEFEIALSAAKKARGSVQS